MSLAIGREVVIHLPGSPNHGKLATLLEDAGVAEFGYAKGTHYWWARVPGREFRLMYEDAELQIRRAPCAAS